MKKILIVVLSLALLAGILLTTGCGKKPASTPDLSTETEGTTGDETEKVSFEGKTLNLYAAAGAKEPMDRVIEIFKNETKADVAVNYGPSGGLYAQIEKGQPCDLYYSADWIYIEKIEENGKLEESNRFLTDNIVLVVSETGKTKVEKLEDLSKKNVVSVIADLQAPAGVYAKNALESLGLWERVSPNIKAMPSTPQQIAIMVKEDQVDAGFILSSVANSFDLKIVETIDKKHSGEIIFGAAVIKEEQTELAKAFTEIATKHADVFEEYGWRSYE